ncbi:DHH family phosphoesterase [Laedolimicola ammoniilytica]|uniref:Bifunctional oligoribonuclease/PAP phosphatase NrnA n=1 Tax=Laedolimicola ammoniilytica TaxID=2981771 RepID=A0ABT2RU02_9FIRM|nr:bifunctional oligoribonuclease/PAP phosphatase NrnA [Laedolimicola ammoniilytica]MCU6695796.1 bifunctional oligoribonuclease/PAP phosphatase NrnA [Laedolimicola ammoniilytica]SCH24711.1 Bifunctional oligoribonuclease and PAP phosphatase nrnA [uncultured Clostridium sp.]
MIRLKNELANVKTVAISGHIRPDGDCIGSCLGVWNYIQDNYPDIQADVYLEQVVSKFRFLKGADLVKTDCSEERNYDLFISLDASDRERLGEAVKYLDTAKRSVCVDHHITNPGFADENWIVADASSASELAWEIMEEEKISKHTAEALYMGIAHDTGVFQYSNTSPKTMQIAGSLIAKGINFSQIVDNTFYKKTYIQNQILGRALVESILLLDGRIIVGRVRQKDMEFYGASPADLDGIVSQLRVTDGVEVAIFLYETGNHQYKVSLRSNGPVDVSAVCAYFGGGGHVKAAGCTMYGTVYDVINNLTLHIEKQLEQLQDV